MSKMPHKLRLIRNETCKRMVLLKLFVEKTKEKKKKHQGCSVYMNVLINYIFDVYCDLHHLTSYNASIVINGCTCSTLSEKNV